MGLNSTGERLDERDESKANRSAVLQPGGRQRSSADFRDLSRIHGMRQCSAGHSLYQIRLFSVVSSKPKIFLDSFLPAESIDVVHNRNNAGEK